ncbi:MAG: iron transporter FeoB [Cyanobium sp. CACIAM 14]|nr:MAG: iron transporter FeoB [Cyanobium sp. CACIAM 14]
MALLGMPNTGKSTLYNRLTGGQAQIANWPGLTVDLLRGPLPPGPQGQPFQLVDLPGIHDLSGSSEDEAIVQRFLRQTPPDLALVVLNASQVGSQLRLVFQIARLGVPQVVALNMSDEARRFGLRIDAGALEEHLGVPVVPISARRNQGILQLKQRIHRGGSLARPVPEEALEEHLDRLVHRCVETPAQLDKRGTRRVDRVLLHPLVGLVAFLAIVLVMFQLIFSIGSPLQELLGQGFDWIQNHLLTPGLAAVGTPVFLRNFLVDGVWLGVTTVSSFLPIIFLFYLVMAVVEDSGYLPRAAFLMDGFMHWLGLDGRSFVLQVMGFGCNVPSIIGTRVIRDPAQRLLTMMVIPFALCQARLTVFLFMAGVFFPRPWWAPGLVVFGFYLLSFGAAIVTGLIFKHVWRSREAFVLELPPYRQPSLATVMRRAWTEMGNFMVTTRGFIVVGASAIWLLTNLPAGAAQNGHGSLADGIGHLFAPIFTPIGMDPSLTVALFFGFIAKEILLGAMAVIYRTSEAGLGTVLQSAISPAQAISFMAFTLLYTPCLATVAAQLRESRSRVFALRSVLWSLILAWLVALVVFQSGQWLQAH